MQLLTKNIKLVLPPLRHTAHIRLEDKMVICRYFLPDDLRSWLILEGQPVEDSDIDDYQFFGVVCDGSLKLDTFLLSELETTSGLLGMSVELDNRLFRKPLRYLAPLSWCKGGLR